MPPLVLMLIDLVFGLALHHDRRARERPSPGRATTRVHAELSGPRHVEPASGGLHVCIVVSSTGQTEQTEETEQAEQTEQTEQAEQMEQAEQTERVALYIDMEEGRLLAAELALAELPLDRSGIARAIGELEAWCYERLPLD